MTRRINRMLQYDIPPALTNRQHVDLEGNNPPSYFFFEKIINNFHNTYSFLFSFQNH